MHLGEPVDVDNFTAGIKKLNQGGLAKWVKRTTMDSGLLVEAEHEGDTSSDSDGLDDEGEEPEMTLGLIHAFDGEVMVHVEDDDSEFPEALADEADAY